MNAKLSTLATYCGVSINSDRDIKNILTDSRSSADTADALFFAIRTDVNDGHRYLADLYRRGVRSFVVDHIPDIMRHAADADFIVVDDVSRALKQIARRVREEFRIPVVGITGSRGKTVVKELLFHALTKADVKVARSPRSWNSQLGVPLSIWQLEPDTDIAVFEAGIDRVGQMAGLAEIIRPNIGIMTEITDEHDNGFTSREEKIVEKAALFSSCDTIICPAADTVACDIIKSLYPGKTVICVGSGDNLNRSLAAEALKVLGYDPTLANDIDEVSTRLDVYDGVNDCLMIYDEFSNDLDSVGRALDFMMRRTTTSRRNTLITGNLLHRPDADTQKLYRQFADMLKSRGIDRLIAIGEEIGRHTDAFDPMMATEFVSDTERFISDYDISRFDSELILIKGGKDFAAIKDLLEKPRHQTIFEVNLDSVVHNYNAFKSLVRPSTGIIAMVKASAYGTGSLEIAKTLQSQGASYLAVAVVEEGVALRRAGITMPIMVLNPMTTNYQALFNYRLEPAVFSLRELDILLEHARLHDMHGYPIHIKLDTGMHRVGFIPTEIEALAKVLNETDRVATSSVFSHLATADCLDENAYTQSQFDSFEAMTGRLKSLLKNDFRRHILNTAGIMRFPVYQYDFVRLGIGLYGISPLPPEETHIDLRPVASLSSTIISLKTWDADTTIGYSRRGQVKSPSVIATIPIGYADGIDRHFGCGRSSFIVNGKPCPTIGNICMDLCMIDVTGADAKIGDRVEIFGKEAPVENLATARGTIPYEILTSVSPRVHRIYYRE